MILEKEEAQIKASDRPNYVFSDLNQKKIQAHVL